MRVGLVQTHRAFAYNNVWANHRQSPQQSFVPRRARARLAASQRYCLSVVFLSTRTRFGNG